MSNSNVSTQDIRSVLNRLEREFGSHAEIAKMLGIAQAHIHNCATGKRKPSRALIGSLQKNGYLPAPKKRIRSQITWESEEQRKYFIMYIKSQHCDSISNYCRIQADKYVEIGRLVGLLNYPIDTGENL